MKKLPRLPKKTLENWQNAYEKMIPELERFAKREFRHFRTNPQKSEEKVADVIELGWLRYCQVRLAGKNPDHFRGVFFKRTCQAIKNHRSVVGSQRAKDAMSDLAHVKYGFTTQALPECDTVTEGNSALEALHDNTRTPPPDQAAFRIDTPTWLERLGPKRPVVEDMMQEYTTKELSRLHGKSEARISQIRREVMENYNEFHGDTADRER